MSVARLRAGAAARRRGEAGFTLLEIMVSLAILSVALVVLIRITTRNVQATNRVKLLTAATFLARAKIGTIEDRVIALGFVDVDEEEAGDFSDEGYSHIAWDSIVERVLLPTDLGKMAGGAQASSGAQQTGQQSPLQFMAGMMGGFMSSLMEPIRIGLQESVRRVTVRVYWNEIGRGEQKFEVVTFMTDPSRLDLAMQGVAGAASAAGAAAGTGTGSRTGGTGSGSTGSGRSSSGSTGAASSAGGTR